MSEQKLSNIKQFDGRSFTGWQRRILDGLLFMGVEYYVENEANPENKEDVHKQNKARM